MGDRRDAIGEFAVKCYTWLSPLWLAEAHALVHGAQDYLLQGFQPLMAKGIESVLHLNFEMRAKLESLCELVCSL